MTSKNEEHFDNKSPPYGKFIEKMKTADSNKSSELSISNLMQKSDEDADFERSKHGT